MALSKDERDGMLQLMSDLSKDALGFRLRLDFSAMTDDELQDHWDYLNRELESSIAREEQEEAQAWADFEAYLDHMESAGASRSQAIRWDMEAHDVNGDVGFYCYHRGISYSKEAAIREMLGGG